MRRWPSNCASFCPRISLAGGPLWFQQPCGRIFSLRLTLECFLWQMLKPRTACREVVRAVQSLFQAQGRGRVDEGTSAYVQARHRLPRERLEKALAHTARTADQRVGSQGQINGRPVKVADGSTTQLPDTQENQQRYPQPSSQKPGCGFPLIKFLVLFSLSSGAILRVAMAHWKNHDLRLLYGLWEALEKGDILLGDRAYGEYSHPGRAPAPRRRCGGPDARGPPRGLSQSPPSFGPPRWSFPMAQRLSTAPKLSSAQQWAQVPAQITVRLLRFDAVIRRRKKRITLVTTLLDPVAYPAQELIGLYGRRWHLELALRHVKTTMGMEMLRCQSPGHGARRN